MSGIWEEARKRDWEMKEGEGRHGKKWDTGNKVN
jgi:hypothetical protein